jgi:hypothetical protein
MMRLVPERVPSAAAILDFVKMRNAINAGRLREMAR